MDELPPLSSPYGGDVDEFVSPDKKPAAMETSGIDAPELPPALPPVGSEGNLKPAAVTEEEEDKTYPNPTFAVSDVKKKSDSGAPLCMALGCEKYTQAGTTINNIGSFCRIHYNAWLISTGQIDSWDCQCGNKVKSDRCGKCHRWKPGAHPGKAKIPKEASKQRDSGSTTLLTHVPVSSGFQVSSVRRTNDKGRSLCKIVGCTKLDQAKNDGFCRTHFNMFAVPVSAVVVSVSALDMPALGSESAAATGSICPPVAAAAAVSGGSSKEGGGEKSPPPPSIHDMTVDWTCVCGKLNSGKKKRCKECNKWRGGKRDKYKPKKNKCIHTETGGNSAAAVPAPSFPKIDANTIDQGHWNCTHCQNKVSLTKSRCGKCHRWRGGKRKGGWKIKMSDKADMSGIEWDKDWTCCDVMIPANKKRCGKCHGWRGGKRVASNKKQKTPVPAVMQQAVAVTEEAASTPSTQFEASLVVAPAPGGSEATFESLVVAPSLPPLPVVQPADQQVGQQEYTTTEFI